MPRITFVDHRGGARIVEIPAGHSLMEGAVNNDVAGILADCGGACSCATCHVLVDPDWVDALPPREAMEEDMLEFAIEPGPTSRLSCQITITDALDGLIVTLPASQL
jgi:2Fe-2S ferredoxin